MVIEGDIEKYLPIKLYINIEYFKRNSFGRRSNIDYLSTTSSTRTSFIRLLSDMLHLKLAISESRLFVENAAQCD